MSSAELRFDGRVAIVTGAGSGVGRAHALLLASRGAAVIVNDLPASDRSGPAIGVVEEILAGGGTAEAMETDVTSEDGAVELVRCAVERFGRLDVLINNAGLLRSADFGEMTTTLFDQVLAVNLRATFLVSNAAWTVMAEQKYGRLLSTTSNSGLLGTAGSTAYASAKAAVWGLTRSLALEGRRLGINVNAIAPIAFTQMSMTSRLAPPSWRSGEGDDWAHRLDPALVAPAAAWLVHEQCDVNGQIWSVAGGRVAQFFMGLSDGFVDDQLTIESVRDRGGELFHDGAFEVLGRAADEGRALRRRLLGS
jgi:NAD(P)-dependent dehydrogenase (short-subunit alcohol dehydrogenase family)